MPAASRASRSTTPSGSSRPSRTTSSPAARAGRRSGSCSPRTRQRRPVARSSSRTLGSRTSSCGSTTPCCPPASGPPPSERIAEEVTLLWQTDEVRHDRLRVTDEIRHGLWFFEHSLMRGRDRPLRRVARATAGRTAAAVVRHLDRRRPGRQPGDRRRVDPRGARPGAHACAAALPRRGARARRRARSSPVARPHLRRARGVPRPRRGGAAGVRRRDRRAQRARAVPAKALVHVVAPRLGRLSQSRGAARRSHRDPCAASPRTAAGGSRTGGSPGWSGWWSSSGSTSPRSTCDCTRATSAPRGRARRPTRRSRHVAITGCAPSTR